MRHSILALPLVVLCASVGLLSCASTPDGAPTAAQQAPETRRHVPPPVLDQTAYALAAGDSVRIDVLGESDLSLVALIDPNGNINYPFLGHIRASGMTVRQLERQIHAGLRAGYLKNPDVRVSIAQFRPIFVSGQVRSTGAYPYTLGLTVDQALTLAGGITQFGSTRRIYIQRAGVATDQREHVSLDSPVYPGDTVVVEERLF